MNAILAENPRAAIGGNAPPLTPFEVAEKAVGDIYSEAAMWLDGAVVADKQTADGIDNLKKMIATARKAADEARKVEKKPFDDGAAEVQGRYTPLLAKADRAKDACNKALEPWLISERKRLDAEAAEARRIADEKRIAAEEAIRATDTTNLAAREEAETLLKDAKKAEAAANRIGKQTATAGGTLGRATGLRTVYVPTITDAVVLARFAWSSHRDEMNEFLTGLVERLVRGGSREIPGCEIREEKRAV